MENYYSILAVHHNFVIPGPNVLFMRTLAQFSSDAFCLLPSTH